MNPQAWESWQEFTESCDSLDEARSDAFWEIPALVLASKCVPNVEEETLSSEYCSVYMFMCVDVFVE